MICPVLHELGSPVGRSPVHANLRNRDGVDLPARTLFSSQRAIVRVVPISAVHPGNAKNRLNDACE